MGINRRQRLPLQQQRLNILHSQPLEAVIRLDGAPGIMARQGNVPHLAQGGVDIRLILEDVEAGGEQPLGPQRVDERVLVHERAARDVDEPRPALELGEPVAVDQRLAPEGRRQDDAVREGEEPVQRVDEGGPDGGLLRRRLPRDVVVVDVHAEGGVRLLRDRVPDVAQPDDAEDVAARVVRRHGRVPVRLEPLRRVAGPRRQVRPCEVSEYGEDVEDCHVGYCFGRCLGAIAV